MAQQTGNKSKSQRQQCSVAFDAVIITLAGAIVAALFQRYAPDAYMVRNAGLSFPCMSRTALACPRHAARLVMMLHITTL